MGFSSPGLTAAASALAIRPDVPDDGLAAFGIRAAAPARQDRNSILKCVLVRGPSTCGIVFRLEPNDPNTKGGSWAEKCFFDALRQKQDWVVRLNIHWQCLIWYHEDIQMVNSKGYGVRLFVIYTTEMPAKESVIKLGEFICMQINAMPNNNTTSVVPDEMSFFWIPTHAVWADIIGTAAAFKTLIETTGAPSQGFYEKHKNLIHSYFRPHTLTHEIATNLRAPIDQVAPHLRVAAEPPAQEPIDLVNDDFGEEFVLEDTEEE